MPREDEMTLKRTATLGLAGGALAAWLAAAATSGIRENRVPPPEPVGPIEMRGAELAAEIARLHDRLRPTAAPQRPGRNLFQFTAAKPRVALAAIPALTEASAPPAPPPPPPVLLKLSGIAEDPGPDGPVRTAIISGLGQLFLVKEGEMLGNQYRVAKISADVVELVEVDVNSTLRLAMK
jgi:hypothetical protein